MTTTRPIDTCGICSGGRLCEAMVHLLHEGVRTGAFRVWVCTRCSEVYIAETVLAAYLVARHHERTGQRVAKETTNDRA